MTGAASISGTNPIFKVVFPMAKGPGGTASVVSHGPAGRGDGDGLHPMLPIPPQLRRTYYQLDSSINNAHNADTIDAFHSWRLHAGCAQTAGVRGRCPIFKLHPGGAGPVFDPVRRVARHRRPG